MNAIFGGRLFPICERRYPDQSLLGTAAVPATRGSAERFPDRSPLGSSARNDGRSRASIRESSFECRRAPRREVVCRPVPHIRWGTTVTRIAERSLLANNLESTRVRYNHTDVKPVWCLQRSLLPGLSNLPPIVSEQRTLAVFANRSQLVNDSRSTGPENHSDALACLRGRAVNSIYLRSRNPSWATIASNGTDRRGYSRRKRRSTSSRYCANGTAPA